MRLNEEFRARTKKYASAAIQLYAKLPRCRKEVEALDHQMIRAGTSVAAHIREASRARSDAEFYAKIGGALQEADETQMWIELLRDDCGIVSKDIDWLHRESDELIAIFATMLRHK